MYYHRTFGSGCSSVVEHDLAKVGVASSSLVTRSISHKNTIKQAQHEAPFLLSGNGIQLTSMIRFVICLILLMLTQSAGARAQSHDPLLGLWQTEDRDAVIQLYKCEDSLCGRFYWLKDDSAETPSLDDNNPNPEKARKPLCGLTFLGGFTKQSVGDVHRYVSGWVYSPRHGSTYSAEIQPVDDKTLSLRGYMFFSFLGGSQTWQRIESAPQCPLFDQKNKNNHL